MTRAFKHQEDEAPALPCKASSGNRIVLSRDGSGTPENRDWDPLLPVAGEWSVGDLLLTVLPRGLGSRGGPTVS